MRRRATALLARLGPPRYLLALLLLIVATAAAHAVWMRRDATPFESTDAYGYLIRTHRFVAALHGWGGTLSLSALAYGGRPPLYQLASVPFVLVFGPSEDGALAVNLAFLAVLMAATYGLGAIVRGPPSGLAAALLVACQPPVVHLVHTFRPNLAVVAAVALSAWALARFVERPGTGAAARAAAALGAGMLLHPTFLWAIAGAAAAGGLAGIGRLVGERRRRAARAAPLRSRRRDLLAVAAAAAVLLLAAAWYLGPGRRLLIFLGNLQSARLVELRGAARVGVGFFWAEPSFWWYARTAPHALSTPLAVLAVAGWGWALVGRRRLDLLAAVGLATAFALLSLQPVYAWIYFAAALPFAAVLAAALLADLRPPPVRRAATAAVAALAAGVSAYVLWGGPPPVARLAALLGERIPTRGGCVHAKGFCAVPAEGGSWHEREILDRVLADPACREEAPCTLLVVSWGGVNHEQFNFHRRRHPRRRALTVAHHGAAELGVPYPFAALLRADYLLALHLPLDAAPASKRFAYGPATARLLARPPPEFAAAHQVVARFTTPDGLVYRLHRRTRPLTRREAEATIAALPIAPRQKGEGAKLLAELAAGSD